MTAKTTTTQTDYGQVISGDARALARQILEAADRNDIRIATAESCTGGLLATLLTDIPGLSHSFECGFVAYSNQAKADLLGISLALIEKHGAVSLQIACAMAEHALARCNADLALSVTGFAGPGGHCDEEGLVFLAVASNLGVAHEEHHFGALGRDPVREKALVAALGLLERNMRCEKSP